MTWLSRSVAGAALLLIGCPAPADQTILVRSVDAYAHSALCINGRPRPRLQVHPHITYGYLPVDPCCERDHFISEGLCIEPWCDDAARNPRLPPTGATGANPGNVWYQPYPDWKIWDIRERKLERNYCAGRIDRMDAWQQLIDGKEK